MSRYETFVKKESAPKKEIHPIWRGIGCAMMVIIPFCSWFGTELVLRANTEQWGIPIPRDLIAPVFIQRVIPDPLLFVRLIITALISFVVYAIFSMVTFVITGLLGPARYGPLDAAPVMMKSKGTSPVMVALLILLVFLVFVTAYVAGVGTVLQWMSQQWGNVIPEEMKVPGPDPLAMVNLIIAVLITIIVCSIGFFVYTLISSAINYLRYGPADKNAGQNKYEMRNRK